MTYPSPTCLCLSGRHKRLDFAGDFDGSGQVFVARFRNHHIVLDAVTSVSLHSIQGNKLWTYRTPPTSQYLSRTSLLMYLLCFGSSKYGSMMKLQK